MAKPTTAPARLSPASRPVHGLDNRGLEAGSIPGAQIGRFGQLFPFMGVILPDECLRDIAVAMIKPDLNKPIKEAEPVDENPAIPAGYTYFGQFVDHDITLDPTSFKARNVDVSALVDFRSPALDLGCVYGSGPDDQPYMYETDGLKLRLGAAVTAPGAKIGVERDLLRLRREARSVSAPSSATSGMTRIGSSRSSRRSSQPFTTRSWKTLPSSKPSAAPGATRAAASAPP